MTYKIDEVEGIGPKYREKLQAVGISTTDDFLSKCGTAAGRKEISEKADISDKLILTWANLADLMRINGIGPQYSELLEASGVDTVKELRHRNAENLAAKMKEVNGEKNLANNTPAASVVQGWIDEAKNTEPSISH